jgi:hypothetical protein
MVVRGYSGEIRYGIFKRLKNFPFKINEMALLRERWGNNVHLIAYRNNTSNENGKRKKITLLEIDSQGMYLSYTWRSSEFDIEVNGNYIKVVGIDLV